MTRTRKTPQSWITAGHAALKKVGPEGLKAETLARDLGTTKGSFYWHFKDVPAFHTAVLDAWSDAAIARFDAVQSSVDAPLAQLRALAGYSSQPLDRAIRAWATHHAGARKAVRTLDSHIISVISDLLAHQGATHPDFPRLTHAAMIMGSAKGRETETLIDLLLVLK